MGGTTDTPDVASVAAESTGPSYRARFQLFTRRTVFLTVFISLATFNFGYDTGSFAGVQAMPQFKKEFGTYDATTKAYTIPSYLSSLFNSTPMLGKLLGALICGSVTERIGRVRTMIAMCIISIVGCVLQVSAKSAAQFVVGRVINYVMIGFIIVLAPIYQGECFPAPLRGMVNATIMIQVSVGTLLASIINYVTKDMSSNAAWLIPTGIQLLLPVVILALVPWMPESPRWLISKGRKEDAVNNLRKLVKKGIPDSQLEAEVSVLSSFSENEGKGSWKEVFDAKNRRRTILCILCMFFQQGTGLSFASQYLVVLCQAQGISEPFLIATYQAVSGTVCVLITTFTVDSFGRRPLAMIGGAGMAISALILGSVGAAGTTTDALKSLMAAMLILFTNFYSLGWGPIAYVILSEVSGPRVKEKTNKLAVAISVISSFVVSFTVPYLMNAPYANLGPKVGFIYGSLCTLSFVFAFFFVPELKNRTIEEVDEIFEARVPAWRTKHYRTTPPVVAQEYDEDQVKVPVVTTTNI